MIITALLGRQALFTVHNLWHWHRRLKAVHKRLLCLSPIPYNIFTGTIHRLFILSDWTWSATESFSQTQTHAHNSWKEDTPSTAAKSRAPDNCQGNGDTNCQGPGRIGWEFAAQSYTTITVHVCASTPHSRGSLFLFP